MKKLNILHMLAIILTAIYALIHGIISGKWHLNALMVYYPFLRLFLLLLLIIIIIFVIIILILKMKNRKKEKKEYVWNTKKYVILGIALVLCIATPASISSYMFSLDTRQKLFTIDEIVTYDQINYKVLAVERKPFGDIMEEMIFTLEAENTKDIHESYSIYDWDLYGENEKGKSIVYDIANITDITTTNTTDIEPNAKTTFTLHFVMPKETYNLELQYMNSFPVFFAFNRIEIPAFAFSIE